MPAPSFQRQTVNRTCKPTTQAPYKPGLISALPKCPETDGMITPVSTPSSAPAASLSQPLSSIGALSSQLQTIVARRFLDLAWQLVEIRCTMDGEGTVVRYGPITHPHKQHYKIFLHPQPQWSATNPARNGLVIGSQTMVMAGTNQALNISFSAVKRCLWLEQTKR